MEARAEPWRPTAIVTGANRGLGLALSAGLSTRGYRVIVSSRSLVAAQEACRTLSMDLSSNTAPDFLPAQLDISCSESCANFATCSDVQGATVLINNAGISSNWFGWEEENYLRTMQTNFLGALNATEELLAVLNDEAIIVNVSSTLALNLSTQWKEKIQACDSLADLKAIACNFDGSDLNMALRLAPAYSISKALLNRATVLLAKDARLTSKSIRVASVSPGWYVKAA